MNTGVLERRISQERSSEKTYRRLSVLGSVCLIGELVSSGEAYVTDIINHSGSNVLTGVGDVVTAVGASILAAASLYSYMRHNSHSQTAAALEGELVNYQLNNPETQQSEAPTA